MAKKSSSTAALKKKTGAPAATPAKTKSVAAKPIAVTAAAARATVKTTRLAAVIKAATKPVATPTAAAATTAATTAAAKKAVRADIAKAGAATATKVPGTGGVTTVPDLDLEINPRPPVVTKFTKKIVRPRDLLVLEFTFVNLKATKNEAGIFTLSRSAANQPAYIVLGLPPQHLLEEAFFETAAKMPVKDFPNKPPVSDKNTPTDEPDNDEDIPVASRLAEPSRIVFRVPDNFAAIPYTVESILGACRDYELSVSPSATPPDPRMTFVPGLEITLDGAGLSNIVNRTLTPASAKTAAAPKSAAAKTAASQALNVTLIEEARNKWYADRSPFGRVAGEIGAAQAAIDLLEKIKLLPKLAEPTATQTAIEAPTRVIVSPNSYGAFVHSAKPVESGLTGRVELWHTRLGVRTAFGISERDDFRRTIRAIWSPDANAEAFPVPSHSNLPFRAPLDASDRHQLVHLSGNHQLYIPDSSPKKRIPPKPIEVERLMLSSLGAWLNVRGTWSPPPGLSLEEWRNRATMGRDHYVRVVYAGRLYPFGHRASLIKITERKFHGGNPGNPAFLRQRIFIVVQEPFVVLGNTGLKDGVSSLDRKMPIKSARLTTLVTPNLDDPENHASAVMDLPGKNTPWAQSLFWPYVGGQPFPFHVQFEDEIGGIIHTTAPLFFLGNEKLDPATGKVPNDLANTLADQYSNFGPFNGLRRLNFFNQRVRLAPSTNSGDTAFDIGVMQFMLTNKSGVLIPSMARASASVPALKHLARSPTAPELVYPARYLQHGFDAAAGKNPREVFLELITPNSTKMDFSSQGDRSGGFLAPNMAINGLSRKLGPVGGNLDDIAKGDFKPDQFFGNLGDMLPKLFGCIKITDILEELGLDDDIAKLPRFVTENLTAADALIGDLNRIKGYVDDLSGKLGSLAAQAAAVKTAAEDVITALASLMGDPLSDAKQTAFRTAFTALVNAAKTLKSGFAGFSVDGEKGFAKTQLEQLLAKFVVGLESGQAVIDLVTRIIETLENLSEQRVKFEWKPEVHSWGLEAGSPIFKVAAPNNCLVIAVELCANGASSKEPSLDVACRLQDFDLILIAPASFLKLHFNKIEFTASSRAKPDVNVDFGGIEFVGVLSFIETLRTLIPLDGFSDPPSLSVTEQGIEASFSLALPNIAVGVFSLSNLALGASLTVPFLGQEPLSVRFNFCERSDPFRLSVWVFGGGGFFAVTVTPAGCQILEASFEFGACAALDFGVASGSVSVMAGIYFKIESDDAALTGYFNLKGRVSVLGLIHASLELNLELTYEFSSGKCIGRASLIIEVEVLFFSASVEIECEKKFAGSNGDPSFVQIMAPYTDPLTNTVVEPWQEYCEAFAA